MAQPNGQAGSFFYGAMVVHFPDSWVWGCLVEDLVA
jgi:hypothetical protein